MKVSAKDFNKKPHDIYYEASKGETVTINHDRYRDVVFELTSRPRMSDFKPMTRDEFREMADKGMKE